MQLPPRYLTVSVHFVLEHYTDIFRENKQLTCTMELACEALEGLHRGQRTDYRMHSTGVTKVGDIWGMEQCHRRWLLPLYIDRAELEAEAEHAP